MASIGISLGSTSMCVAVVQDERPTVIVNQQGHRTTSACVAFTADETIVGDTARQVALKRPREACQNVPLLLGGRTADGLRRRHLAHELIEEDGRVTGFVASIDGEEVKHSLESACAPLLNYMKQEAEAFLGDKVEQCSIAVPEAVARDEESVRLLCAAAEKSGMRVARVMRASAAALIHDVPPADGTHIVVDIGGCCTSISVYEVLNGVLRLVKTESVEVGGLDVDKAVAKHFADEFKKKTKMDLSDDARAMRRLVVASEDTKKTLSQRPQGRVECEALSQGVDFHSALSRGRFDLLLGSVLGPIRDALQKVVAETGEQSFTAHLVGGTGHIQKVKGAVEAALGCEVVRPQLPEEATALGAAVQSALCAKGVGLPNESVWQTVARGSAGSAVDKHGVQCRVSRLTQPVGIRLTDGVHTLIEQGALLPSEGSWSCPAKAESAMLVEIVQGAGEDAKPVCRLAVRKVSQEAKELRVTARAAVDGTLQVTATDGFDVRVHAEVPRG